MDQTTRQIHGPARCQHATSTTVHRARGREPNQPTISKRALPSVLITAEARATCRNRKPVDHARGAVRWIRQQRAPAPPPPGLRFPNPHSSSLSARHSRRSSPPRLPRSLAPSSGRPSLARLGIPARNVPSVASLASSPPHPVLVRSLPLYFPVSLGSFAALDLGCLIRFVGTFFNLCWDSIDALFGCFSVEHFVEHRGGGPSMVQKSK